MATSLADLLGEIPRLTADATPSEAHAHQAISALDHAGRALLRLATDGVEPHPAAHSPRNMIVADLGHACRRAADAWPTQPGRLPDLLGAAADIVGLRRADLGRAERWSLAVEIAAATRACVDLTGRFLPYQRLTALARVHRMASAVEQRAATDPPDPRHRTALDQPLPRAQLPAGLAPAQTAAEAAPALAAALRYAIDHRRLTVTDALAAAAAAHAAAQATVLQLGPRPGGTRPAWRLAPAGWRAVEHQLRGARDARHSDSDVPRWAIRLHAALRRDPRSAAEVAAQLPALATLLEAGINSWLADRQLFAPARQLPYHPQHLDAVLHDQAVTVTRRDAAALLTSVQIAGRLSVMLAAEATPATGDPQRPHLAAAHAARAAGLRAGHQLGRDLAQLPDLAPTDAPAPIGRAG